MIPRDLAQVRFKSLFPPSLLTSSFNSFFSPRTFTRFHQWAPIDDLITLMIHVCVLCWRLAGGRAVREEMGRIRTALWTGVQELLRGAMGGAETDGPLESGEGTDIPIFDFTPRFLLNFLFFLFHFALYLSLTKYLHVCVFLCIERARHCGTFPQELALSGASRRGRLGLFRIRTTPPLLRRL